MPATNTALKFQAYNKSKLKIENRAVQTEMGVTEFILMSLTEKLFMSK